MSQLNQNVFRIEIQTKITEDNYERTVINAIDESLSSIIHFNKQILYKYIEKKYNIKKNEIPSKIEEFSDSIEKIFGEAAKLIEIKIIQQLQNKTQFRYRLKSKDLVFVEYVAALRTFLSNR